MLPVGLNEVGAKTYAAMAPRWAAVIAWLGADPSRAALRHTLDPQIAHWREIDRGAWFTDASDLIGSAEDLQLVEMYAAEKGYAVPGPHVAVPDPVALNAAQPEKLQAIDDWARSHPVVDAVTSPADPHIPTQRDWNGEMERDVDAIPWWVWALGGGAVLSAGLALFYGGRAAVKYGPALAPLIAPELAPVFAAARAARYAG